MSIYKKSLLIQFLDLEDKRSNLAVAKNYKDLLATYKKRRKENNKNTGKFWDTKFSSDISDSFPMEEDRNAVASLIYRRLVKNNFQILNIGSGDGNFEKLVYGSSKVNYLGIDLAQNTINKLKSIFPKYKFECRDIVKTKLQKNKYDLICMFEVLEHIADYDTFSVLEKINTSLKKRGLMILSVPLNEPLLEMFPLNPNAHMRRYKRELILAELKIAGFKIISFYEFASFQQFYLIKKILWKYLLPNKWNANNILIVAQK